MDITQLQLLAGNGATVASHRGEETRSWSSDSEALAFGDDAIGTLAGGMARSTDPVVVYVEGAGWADTVPVGGHDWNAEAVLVGDVLRVPVDDLESASSQDRTPGAQRGRVSTHERADHRAIAYVPLGADAWTSAIDVLLIHHGQGLGARMAAEDRNCGLKAGEVYDMRFMAVADALSAAGGRAIAVLPQGTHEGNGFSEFYDSEAAQLALVTEVLNKLASMDFGGQAIVPAAPTVERLVLIGHSAGGDATLDVFSTLSAESGADGGSAASIQAVVLFDAVNNPDELSRVRSWLDAQFEIDSYALSVLPDADAQYEYLEGSVVFRGYYTRGGGYEERYTGGRGVQSKLSEIYREIDALNLDDHVRELLLDNYQGPEGVRPVGRDHDEIVGSGLRDALSSLDMRTRSRHWIPPLD